jgi:alcohol dehydrogenase class IV
VRFEFATATRIVFGEGAAAALPEIARSYGARPLVVTGATPQRAASLVSSLSAEFFPVPGEPTVDLIREGVRRAREAGCDVVISIGGGSAIDAGKAIAAIATNGGEPLDFLEVIGKGRTIAATPLPFIAVPTTAGTGSEVTRNAVLGSPEHGVKASLRSPLMLPRVALVDPELTYLLPPAITASTGLDALTQLIEPYVSARANPLVDPFCVDGITRVARSLRRAFHDSADPDGADPDDANLAARRDMSLASLFGGLALANAGLGAVHGFAGPIGGMFPDAPHGAICAALLPHVMAANIRALRRRDEQSPALKGYDRIARICTGDEHASADAGVTWVRELIDELQIPRLGTYGVKSEHVDKLVGKAIQASSMKANPITLTPDELAETLQQAL